MPAAASNSYDYRFHVPCYIFFYCSLLSLTLQSIVRGDNLMIAVLVLCRCTRILQVPCTKKKRTVDKSMHSSNFRLFLVRFFFHYHCHLNNKREYLKRKFNRNMVCQTFQTLLKKFSLRLLSSLVAKYNFLLINISLAGFLLLYIYYRDTLKCDEQPRTPYSNH